MLAGSKGESEYVRYRVIKLCNPSLGLCLRPVCLAGAMQPEMKRRRGESDVAAEGRSCCCSHSQALLCVLAGLSDDDLHKLFYAGAACGEVDPFEQPPKMDETVQEV